MMGKALSGKLSCPCDRSCVKSYKQSRDFKGKIGFYFPEITLIAEFPGRNLLLPTFSRGSKRDLPVVNLLLLLLFLNPAVSHTGFFI